MSTAAGITIAGFGNSAILLQWTTSEISGKAVITNLDYDFNFPKIIQDVIGGDGNDLIFSQFHRYSMSFTVPLVQGVAAGTGVNGNIFNGAEFLDGGMNDILFNFTLSKLNANNTFVFEDIGFNQAMVIRARPSVSANDVPTMQVECIGRNVVVNPKPITG